MIHETAIIDSTAELDEGVTVGPYAIIGRKVKIGKGSWIGPHAVVNGPTTMGRDNAVYQFASIGEAPQDKKYDAEDTELVIGDRNIFRECTTVTRGTVQDDGKTVIGDDNLLMAYVHVAHDCVIGNHVTFSNNASLAGHVRVQDHANLGGFSGVHQFSLIGAYSFCAGGSIITKDVPPYCTVAGHPAELHGLNVVGLKRRGFTEDSISGIKKAYKVLYRQHNTLSEGLAILKEMVESEPDVQRFIDFCDSSTRGTIR